MKKPNNRSPRPTNLRCRICNAVSDAEISDDFGDHSYAAFYEEEDRLGYLCHECYTAVTGAIDDFSLDDDFDENWENYDFYDDDEGE